MTLLELRRVNKRLQERLSTIKTNVSQLKNVSGKIFILLPNVMVSFPFKNKGYLEYYKN